MSNPSSSSPNALMLFFANAIHQVVTFFRIPLNLVKMFRKHRLKRVIILKALALKLLYRAIKT